MSGEQVNGRLVQIIRARAANDVDRVKRGVSDRLRDLIASANRRRIERLKKC